MGRIARAAVAASLLALAPAAFGQIVYTYAVVQPVGLAFSEEDLRRTVADAIADDDTLRGATIVVRVLEGRVVLDGIALSPSQARQARAVAEYAVGPEHVAEPTLEVAMH